MKLILTIPICLIAVVPLFADDPSKKEPPVDIMKFVPTPEPAKLPEDLRKPGVFDEEYPIPQDAAKAEKLRADRLAWARKRYVSPFEATADQAAPWYAKARKAIDAIAVGESAVNKLDSRTADPMMELSREARIDECQHPLLMMLTFKWFGINGEPGTGTFDEITPLVHALLDGPYPPSVKAKEAWDMAVRFENAGRKPARDYYQTFWKEFIELAKTKDRFDARLVIDLARTVEQRYVELGQKRSDGHAAVLRALDQAAVEPWVKGTVEGMYRIALSQDADRTTNPAEAEKLRKERLTAARKALTAAWESAKDQPIAPTQMITVCSLEKSPREELEIWFTRAMEADPDNLTACRIKLSYLLSSGKDRAKLAIAFGRQCLRTQNDHAALGYILDDAHRAIGSGKGNEYYAEADTWADLRELYETRLKRIPNDRYARTRYGQICLAAGEGPGALHNLTAIKTNPWRSIYAPGERFNDVLREAAELAAEQTKKPESESRESYIGTSFGTAEGTSVAFGKLKATTPGTWVSEKPANRLRSHQFKLPSGDKDYPDAELIVLPEGNKDPEKMFPGWKKQFAPPDGKTLDEMTKTETLTVGSAKVHVLDVTGTWSFKERPQDPKSKLEIRPEFRAVWMIVVVGDDAWHIRFSGPEQIVLKHHKDVMAWIKSLK